ncbi:putative DEAD-box ATP-dependent RNA helicase 48 [Drosera capensis]
MPPSTARVVLLPRLLFLRHMGCGPRTFPVGLNKWQWKRLHEKKARDKEKLLLNQEKELYQARLCSQIRRANLGDKELKPDVGDYMPMLPEDHVKALTDRLVKAGAGADDLWNEDDRPISKEGVVRDDSLARARECEGVDRVVNSGNALNLYWNWQQKRGYSTSVMKLFGNWQQRREYSVISMNLYGNWERMRDYSVNLMNFYRNSVHRRYSMSGMSLYGSWEQRKGYSMNRSRVSGRVSYRRNESSESEDDDGGVVVRKKEVRWPRFEIGEDDDEEEGRGKSGWKFGSSAALGKHDVKVKEGRGSRRFKEDEDDGLSERVERIRQEVIERKMLRDEEEKSTESFLSDKRFEDSDISPLTLKALTSAGYMQMTRVQEATLSLSVAGKDAFVKAGAGTGKSLAFLVPAIDAVLKAATCNRVQRVPPIYVLILCPTRELASQLVAETRALLKYHDGLDVQGLIGGTRFKDDLKRIESNSCQILVATPGRLLDHIESKSAISVRLMGLKMVILDEADHLLDLGFRKDLEKIVDCLPRQRQSLLFSATIPKEVRRVSQLVLKRDHAFVDMIGVGNPETSYKVKQSYLVAPHILHFHLVHQVLKDHISRSPDYKVIVFCTTGMVASLMYQLFYEMRLNVRETHSRKPQVYRSRISEEFRQSKRIILISSDVSARGLNYPDVTMIIQMGVPSDREQYIHRLGRTGREDKVGEGILLLAPWEEYFLDDLKDIPIERSSLPHIDPEMKVKLDDSLAKIDSSVKEAAYHAWLGYYNSIKETGRDKTTLVDHANKFSESIGLAKPPSLLRKTALKMGLKDIAGIRIRKYHSSQSLFP